MYRATDNTQMVQLQTDDFFEALKFARQFSGGRVLRDGELVVRMAIIN